MARWTGSKPNAHYTTSGTAIIWQADPEDSIAEAAILVQGYSDVIELTQNEDTIRLNYETLNEFIKTLKTIKDNK